MTGGGMETRQTIYKGAFMGSSNLNVRIVFVENEGGGKEAIKPEEIKKGMRFQMFEPDNTPIAGGRFLTAASDAYLDNDGVVTIEIAQ